MHRRQAVISGRLKGGDETIKKLTDLAQKIASKRSFLKPCTCDDLHTAFVFRNLFLCMKVLFEVLCLVVACVDPLGPVLHLSINRFIIEANVA